MWLVAGAGEGEPARTAHIRLLIATAGADTAAGSKFSPK